ncbi:Hypothetical predicted protein [Pelobates cultripes]|uniref:Uncharacterized protein n=1 Tax=Pelobates cultripes TaxID=61616 RepID=A0AAD1S8R7_PELCU|nr:Hypothetical predicted protein [Pelobates cultripes]
MQQQLQTLTADLQRELQEIGNRTAQMESKMEKYVEAHNSLADKLQEFDDILESHRLKLADMEDRAKRNNLRFRGIPETVPNAELQHYLSKMFQSLVPELHPDQLIIDRAHRLCRPKHLPQTAVRDVIARIHFFHAKDRILRASRSSGMPPEYSSLKIFADISADTLHFRKSMVPITSILQEDTMIYRWGFPAKLLISHQDAIHSITTLKQGAQKLGDWGLTQPAPESTKSRTVPRRLPEWTVK